ncbi:MAG: hypothetical protein OXC37_00410 [Bdellovibrionaceae bacterium]|nr:hypothetical protein [Pseudobdellovibrionaceae bacterium]
MSKKKKTKKISKTKKSNKKIIKKPSKIKNSTKKNTKKKLNKKISKIKKLNKKIIKKVKKAIDKNLPLKTIKKQKKIKNHLKQKEKILQRILEKEKEEKMILKDMQGRNYCQIENCDYSETAEGYCRIHFFGLYNVIKKKKEILDQDILTKKFSNLVEKHSEEIFESLFKDLSSDKGFKTALKKIHSEDVEDIDF